MNRFLQIGDLVIISHSDYTDSYYIVYDIKPNEIYIDNPNIKDSKTRLIPDRFTKKWKVENDDLGYSIQFLEHPFMTKNPIIDLNILLYLNNQSLNAVCELDEYTKELCKDQIFWKNKIEKDYPTFPIFDDYKDYKKLYGLIDDTKKI